MIVNKQKLLSLISTYGQEEWLSPNQNDYPRFLHMDKEEWLKPNLYDYP
jgi:hypothetical protein